MDITDKWLGEIGGWQAMKAARSLLGAGAVQVTERTPETVRGAVGQGKNRITSGLRFRSRSEVENLCTCLTARRDGRICEHALAVALASLNPEAAMPASGPAPTSRSAPSARPAPPIPASPTTGQWSVYLPESLLSPQNEPAMPAGARPHPSNWRGPTRPQSVFVKWEPTGTEGSTLNAWLAERGVARQSCPLQMPEAEWPPFLTALTDHPRVYLGRPGTPQARQIAVTDVTIRPLLQLEFKATGDPAEVELRVADALQWRWLTWSDRRGEMDSWLLHVEGSSLHPWPLLEAKEVRQAIRELFLTRKTEGIVRPLVWWIRHQKQLQTSFQIVTLEQRLIRYKVVPVPAPIHVHLSGNERRLKATLSSVFQGVRWNTGHINESFPFVDEHDESLFYTQNVTMENRALAHFRAIGFTVDPQESHVFHLQGERAITRFYASHLPALQEQFAVESDEQWQRATRDWLRIAPVLQPQATAPPVADSHGIDWLSASIDYRAADGFRLGRNDVLRLLRSGQVGVSGQRHQRYLIDTDQCEAFEESLRDIPLELTASGARFPSRYAGYLLPQTERQALAAITDQEMDLDRLKASLGDLGAQLRPYQLEGVAWLQQRMEAGQGALLADDMGLGKTLQSIAAIVLKLRQTAQPRPQALVICPKSLISNWAMEFQRFAPDVKVAAISGSQREKQFWLIHKVDVIITSYQLIVRDLQHYQKQPFGLVVMDEASFVRNPETETAKAIRALPFRCAIALSGTPVENGVRDLWSIFEIILPGYLGNRSHFQERFEKPMHAPENPAAGAAAQRLRRLIRPFFLRRSKSEVLTELPAKIEQVLWCEPSPAQAELYRRLLEEGREEIRLAKRRSGQQGARMTMLTLLLRLRQTCCDFRLTGVTDKTTEAFNLDDWSGKWPVLVEALNEAVASQSKVLIFSQFVANLQLLRDILDDLNFRYSYLDGATQDRAGAIAKFQNDPECVVFLISLKAGGYGLNLTQADRVFLLDPWWNPAVEAQAIDRAHRFGQTRSVNAYRLIMKGTVEERILELQNKKRNVIAAAIEDRAPMMTGLTDEDLNALLELD